MDTPTGLAARIRDLDSSQVLLMQRRKEAELRGEDTEVHIVDFALRLLEDQRKNTHHRLASESKTAPA